MIRIRRTTTIVANNKHLKKKLRIGILLWPVMVRLWWSLLLIISQHQPPLSGVRVVAASASTCFVATTTSRRRMLYNTYDSSHSSYHHQSCSIIRSSSSLVVPPIRCAAFVSTSLSSSSSVSATTTTAATSETGHIDESETKITNTSTTTAHESLCFYRHPETKQWVERIEFDNLREGQELSAAVVVSEKLKSTKTGPKIWVDCGVGRYRRRPCQSGSSSNNSDDEDSNKSENNGRNNKSPWRMVFGMLRLPRTKDTVAKKKAARLRKKSSFPVVVSRIYPSQDQFEVILSTSTTGGDHSLSGRQSALKSTSQLQVGDLVPATIAKVLDYGLLVSINGYNRHGLLHISQISEYFGFFIDKTRGLEQQCGLKRGVQLLLQVRENERKGRLLLEFPSPPKQLHTGDTVKGRIVKVLDYGVLVQIMDDDNNDDDDRTSYYRPPGLLHISKVADLYQTYIPKAKGLEEFGLEKGARVRLQVIERDNDNNDRTESNSPSPKLWLDFTDETKAAARQEAAVTSSAGAGAGAPTATTTPLTATATISTSVGTSSTAASESNLDAAPSTTATTSVEMDADDTVPASYEDDYDNDPYAAYNADDNPYDQYDEERDIEDQLGLGTY